MQVVADCQTLGKFFPQQSKGLEPTLEMMVMMVQEGVMEGIMAHIIARSFFKERTATPVLIFKEKQAVSNLSIMAGSLLFMAT